MLDTNDPILQFTPLWGAWQAESLIGEGSYGRVYCISREDIGGKYVSALKHIHIPRSEQELEAARQVGMDEPSLSLYFGDMASKIVAEIKAMYTLRGQPNIVAYEDHLILHEEDSLTWDVFLRMELLHPLPDYMQTHMLSPEDVRRLGAEICAALSACHSKGIIHRDIKDGNIFLSEDGVYKLGDFGIARTLLEQTHSMTMRGTPVYLAPEVYGGKPYDARVDIYSLGILLYKLLNDRRYPFLPPAPAAIGYGDMEKAFARRMQGEPLPPPANGDPALQAVVLKACSHDAADRYQTADELRAALLQDAPLQLSTQAVSSLTSGETAYLPGPAYGAAAASTRIAPPAKPRPVSRIWKRLLAGAAVLAGLLAILLAVTFLRQPEGLNTPPHLPPYDAAGLQPVAQAPGLLQETDAEPGYITALYAYLYEAPELCAYSEYAFAKYMPLQILGETEGWYYVDIIDVLGFLPKSVVEKGAPPAPQPAADGGLSLTFAQLEGTWVTDNPSEYMQYQELLFYENQLQKDISIEVDGVLYADREQFGTYEIKNGNQIIPYVMEVYLLADEEARYTMYRQLEPIIVLSITEDTLVTATNTFRRISSGEPIAPPPEGMHI